MKTENHNKIKWNSQTKTLLITNRSKNKSKGNSENTINWNKNPTHKICGMKSKQCLDIWALAVSQLLRFRCSSLLTHVQKRQQTVQALGPAPTWENRSPWLPASAYSGHHLRNKPVDERTFSNLLSNKYISEKGKGRRKKGKWKREEGRGKNENPTTRWLFWRILLNINTNTQVLPNKTKDWWKEIEAST